MFRFALITALLVLGNAVDRHLRFWVDRAAVVEQRAQASMTGRGSDDLEGRPDVAVR
jgi:hypothetical protein